MRTRHRVVWNKGMFLNPQHFQTQDQFFADNIQFRFDASNYANWGVTKLEVDTEALSNSLFRLNACSGIMPDGEPFEMPEVDGLPASRLLKGGGKSQEIDHFPPSRATLDVFIGIPERKLRARNVGMEEAADAEASGSPKPPPSTRYVAETRLITDDYSGEEEKPVQVGLRTFRVLFEDEYRDGYSVLRVGQLSRDPAGTPILNPQFVAPCLDLGSSTYLLMLLRRQIEILATKSSALSAPRRQRGKVVAEFSPSETANFWLLHTVNSYLPELKHIWKVRRGHPEPAYVAMLRLAGALTTFSLEGRPENLPDYEHADLGKCFTLLDSKIRDLMETVIPSKFITVPLEMRDHFVWSGSVTEDRYFRNSQFFLAISSRIGIDDLIRKVPQLVKISSQDDIQRLIRNALPGVSLRHSPVPPPAIPMKLDNQYFSLNQSGSLWDAIMLSRQIAVHVPGEIADPKMEIIVVVE